MSEKVHCDNCGAEGRRKMMKVCPEGWSYAEIKMEDHLDGGGEPEVVFIYACSDKCQAVKWKPGPGSLRNEDPPRFPHTHREGAETTRFDRVEDDEAPV